MSSGITSESSGVTTCRTSGRICAKTSYGQKTRTSLDAWVKLLAGLHGVENTRVSLLCPANWTEEGVLFGSDSSGKQSSLRRDLQGSRSAHAQLMPVSPGLGPPRNQIQAADTMSPANAMGPCRAAWVSCNCQPKTATKITSGTTGARLARNSARAPNNAAKNTAQDAVRLVNEPTPPTHLSTQGYVRNGCCWRIRPLVLIGRNVTCTFSSVAPPTTNLCHVAD